MALTERQKEELLSTINKGDPKSIQDIADLIGVHYATASRWMKELESSGAIRPMPFLRGKEKVYVLALKEDELGIPLIQVGKQVATVSELAVAGSSNAYAYSMACMMYLYRKSYNQARGEGYLGPWTPVEIRAQIREMRARLLNQFQALEQILLRDEFFTEDGKAHEFMGQLGPNLIASIDEVCKPVDDKYKAENTVG